MSYIINKIIKLQKISDYLHDKGIEPSRVSFNKYVYKCPLHEGDNTPSFFVYIKDDGEDFYCQGCKVGGNIINLWSKIEKKSIKDAISHFSKKLDIDIDEYLSESIENDLLKVVCEDDNKKSIEEEITGKLLYIGSIVREFLYKVDFDEKEFNICDKLCMLSEKLSKGNDVNNLSIIVEEIPEKLGYRYKKYIELKEKDQIEEDKIWLVL